MSAREPLARDRLALLYREAMRLAEATRGYFDHDAEPVRAAMPPHRRALLAIEGARATAQIVEVISQLLVQQEAVMNGRTTLLPMTRNPVMTPPLPGWFPVPAADLVGNVRALHAEVCASVD